MEFATAARGWRWELDVWTDVWVYGCMDVWMYGCMDVWMYGTCTCMVLVNTLVDISITGYIAHSVQKY